MKVKSKIQNYKDGKHPTLTLTLSDLSRGKMETILNALTCATYNGSVLSKEIFNSLSRDENVKKFIQE